MEVTALFCDPKYLGALNLILDTDSISAPPLAAEEVVNEFTENGTLIALPSPSVIVPLNVNVFAPLVEAPLVVTYEISTTLLLLSFSPNTPSPKNISYFSSSTSLRKNTLSLEPTDKILSAFS